MLNLRSKLFLTAVLFLTLPLIVDAVSIGDVQIFNVERNYDFYNRTEIRGILQRITNRIYFYVEENWWNGLDRRQQLSLDEKIYNLGTEFERKIYPELTLFFGSEAEIGADGDERITVLFHRMLSGAGGYFNSGDIYEKIQYPRSNQRKMVYLNSQYLDRPEVDGFLAHEFVHLITVNQKDLLRNVTEETWLNEARAEYSTTFLGYDDVYQGSNLERRTNDFLRNPKVSLTEWLNRREDYGAVNLFIQYLVDHYGKEILADSLRSNSSGIKSINYALRKNNFQEDFDRIFTDWIIAVMVNNCNFGKKYCYLSKNLDGLRIAPEFYSFPRVKTELKTDHSATYWAGNWHRFIGGEDYFALEFKGDGLVDFKVPYLLCDFKENCSVDFLTLDKEQKGEVTISDFKTKYASLTVMPFINSKTSGFDGKENYFDFFWKASTYKELPSSDQDDLNQELSPQIKELKKQVAELQAEVLRLQARLAVLLGGAEPVTCDRFDNNLYFGIRESEEVRCLQEFLASPPAGGPDIYPEGQVTGNFLSLTQQAVIRFQEKYASEILFPLGLQQGTGYVGPATRDKINQLLK